MKKKFVSCALIALAALPLTACGGQASSSSEVSSTTSPTTSSGEVVEANKTALIALVQAAEGEYSNKEALYTEATFTAFKTALTAAKSVIAKSNATQEEVDGAKTALQTAIDGLVKVAINAISLAEALKVDYSNCTVGAVQKGEQDTGYLVYNADGYNIVEDSDGNPEDPYLFYHDYKGENYLHFGDHYGNGEAWLKNGYSNVPLGIENTYFSISYAVENIKASDFTKVQDGLWATETKSVIEQLEQTVFKGNVLQTQAEFIQVYVVTNTTNITQIVGVCNTQATSYVKFAVADVGETLKPNITIPEAPNESNVKTYQEWSGKDPINHKDIVSMTLEAKKALAPIEIEDKIEVYLSVDPLKQFDSFLSEFVISDRSVISASWGTSDVADKKLIVLEGIKEGTSKFSMSYANPEDKKTIVSNTLEITVKGLAKDTLEGSKSYDLTLSSLTPATGEEQTVSFVNSLNNDKPLSVAGNHLAALEPTLGDGPFAAGAKVLSLNVGNLPVNTSKKLGMDIDLKAQQISGIAFDYALQYSSQNGNKDILSAFRILTKNPGDADFTLVKDIASEIKNNISNRFLKHFEISFQPSSMIRIELDRSMVGKALAIGTQSLRFYSNNECASGKNDDVALTGVSLADISLEAGKNVTLNAASIPTEATGVTYSYKVLDESIATVAGSLLTAIKEGTTTVEVSAIQGAYVKTATAKLTVTPAYKVLESVSLEKAYSFDIDEIKTVPAKLTPIINPTGAKDVVLSYSSDNNNVLTVAADGTISAYKTGVANVTLTATQKGVSVVAKTVITITQVLPTDIPDAMVGTFKGDGEDLTSGLISLEAKFTKATPSTLSLKIDSTAYEAALSAVTGKNSFEFATSDGTATFSVEYVPASDSINIACTDVDSYIAISTLSRFVYVPVTGITLNKTTLELEVGASETLKATVTPNDASSKKLTWESNAKNIATVDYAGKVTAKAAGTAIITVKSADGIAATATVTVVEPKPAEGIPTSVIGNWSAAEIYDDDYNYLSNVSIVVTSNGATFSDDDYGPIEFDVIGTIVKTTYGYIVSFSNAGGDTLKLECNTTNKQACFTMTSSQVNITLTDANGMGSYLELA